MKREEDWLRDACAELAEEETDQWERSLSAEDIRQAEDAYRRHGKTARSLIRRKSARSAAAPYWRAAAILALIAGALYFSFRQAAPERMSQAQPPAATVGPYMTGAPTAGFAALATERPADLAAAQSVPTPDEPPVDQTVLTNDAPPEEENPVGPPDVPTEPPIAASDPAPEPTAAPSPAPTSQPSPVPTCTPEPTPAVSPTRTFLSPPEGWTGRYFPMVEAAETDAAFAGNKNTAYSAEDGFQTASYAWDGGAAALNRENEPPAARSAEGWELSFTEYASSVAVQVPEDADVSYVQIADGVIALRAETAEGVTLTWDQAGQTLSLFVSRGVPPEAADPLSIARTVKKIEEE